MEYHRGRLIDHLNLVVADLGASRAFYAASAGALGGRATIEDGPGFFSLDELFVSAKGGEFGDGPVTHLHLAFQAGDEDEVRAWHAAVLAAGGRDNGGPGPRDYHPGYYAAFALDPDGNNVEAVFHGPATRSAESVVFTAEGPGDGIVSVLIAIPARYASTRYPAKPLAMLRGATGEARSLIRRSWDAARAVRLPEGAPRVVVATDDELIRAHAEGFGAEVVMTSEAHRNGTERCAEAAEALGGGFDVVVNLQGDAPLTPPWFVEALVAGLRSSGMDAATPVLRMEGAALAGFLEDRRAGRVGGTTAVFGAGARALYFSKEVIPFTARTYGTGEATPVFHHVGVYAYAPAALRAYGAWAPGPLEKLEGLEQLRFLEQGAGMLCVEVEARGRSFWELNNPEDVPRIEAMMAAMGIA